MTKTIPLLQLSLVLGLGFATAACQTVSDAADSVGSAVSDLNPFGGDDSAPPPPAADAGATSSDTNTATTPDLANLPSPPVSSTPAQQQATAQSLAADGAQARYSADNLRAGTEAAAPPPAAADVPPSAVAAAAPPPAAADAPPSAAGDMPPSAATASAPPSASDAPPSASDRAPIASSDATAPSAAPPSAQSLAYAAPPSAAASSGPASAPSPVLSQGTAAVPVGPSSAPVQTASLAPIPSAAIPPGAEPAVPANTPVRGAVTTMGSQIASDAALGFKPSSAPPLDASINQWVSAPIVAHYRQTASIAGSASTSNAAVPARGAAVSSGPVVANLDAVSTGPAGSIAAMNGGVAPTAVIYFPGDGTTLSAAARAQIRNAVAQYKASGGDASVRVVGHASSRTANMSIEKHLEVIFDKSQARANAVAQELIHEGVPAAKVLVEAVGDSQPVYYESMPQGEDGNRRAEIFVQG